MKKFLLIGIGSLMLSLVAAPLAAAQTGNPGTHPGATRKKPAKKVMAKKAPAKKAIVKRPGAKKAPLRKKPRKPAPA